MVKDFIKISYMVCQLPEVSMDIRNGLAPIWHQVITFNKADQDLLRKYVALGPNGLKFLHKFSLGGGNAAGYAGRLFTLQ